MTNAKESARVKGRAQLAFRFDTIEFEGGRHAIRTRTVSMEAEATKGEDAKRIGIGAGVSTIIGGIAGGGKGAAIGAGCRWRRQYGRRPQHARQGGAASFGRRHQHRARVAAARLACS